MAVQSDNKPFIEAILYFPEDVQYDLKYFIEATLEQMANGVLCSGDIILSRSLQPPKGTSIFNQGACVCVCLHACMHACLFAHARMYVCVYVCIYLHSCPRMY